MFSLDRPGAIRHWLAGRATPLVLVLPSLPASDDEIDDCIRYYYHLFHAMLLEFCSEHVTILYDAPPAVGESCLCMPAFWWTPVPKMSPTVIYCNHGSLHPTRSGASVVYSTLGYGTTLDTMYADWAGHVPHGTKRRLLFGLMLDTMQGTTAGKALWRTTKEHYLPMARRCCYCLRPRSSDMLLSCGHLVCATCVHNTGACIGCRTAAIVLLSSPAPPAPPHTTPALLPPGRSDLSRYFALYTGTTEMDLVQQKIGAFFLSRPPDTSLHWYVYCRHPLTHPLTAAPYGIASLTFFSTLAGLPVPTPTTRLLILSIDPLYTHLCARWHQPHVIVFPGTMDEYIVNCSTAFGTTDLVLEWYTTHTGSRMAKLRTTLELLSNSDSRDWSPGDLALVASDSHLSARLYGTYRTQVPLRNKVVVSCI